MGASPWWADESFAQLGRLKFRRHLAVETLETFIIDEQRKRERRRHELPAVELPLPEPELDTPPRKTDTEEETPKRGVVVIDLLG